MRVVRPSSDVDDERDEGEPRADAGRERREEEQAEARRILQQPEREPP